MIFPNGNYNIENLNTSLGSDVSHTFQMHNLNISANKLLSNAMPGDYNKLSLNDS